MFQCVNAAEDGDQPDPPKPVPRPVVKDEDEETEGQDEQPPEAETPEISPERLARFFG